LWLSTHEPGVLYWILRGHPDSAVIPAVIIAPVAISIQTAPPIHSVPIVIPVNAASLTKNATDNFLGRRSFPPAIPILVADSTGQNDTGVGGEHCAGQCESVG
jgi:hypothetical protein